MCRLVCDYRMWTGTVEGEVRKYKGKSVRELKVSVCVLLFLCLYLHVIILSGLLRCNNVSIIHWAQYNVNVWRLHITMVTVGKQECFLSVVEVFLLLLATICTW